MYVAISEGIKVVVEPRFLPEHSSPEAPRFVWAYTVEITNLSSEIVQLRERYWLITDGNGIAREVRGPGVVGEQPRLLPGQSFQYSSACPLETPSGIMRGHYVMHRADGSMFTAEVPAFSLDSPFDHHTVN